MKDKTIKVLAVVGAITVVYLGVRATAVALDPEVHAAARKAGKAVLAAAKQAQISDLTQ